MGIPRRLRKRNGARTDEGFFTKKNLLQPGRKFIRVRSRDGDDSDPMVALDESNVVLAENLTDDERKIARLYMLTGDRRINCEKGRGVFWAFVSAASNIVAKMIEEHHVQYPSDTSALHRAFSDLFNLAVMTKIAWIIEHHFGGDAKKMPDEVCLAAEELDEIMMIIAINHAEDEDINPGYPTPLSLMRHAYVHMNGDKIIAHILSVLQSHGAEVAKQETIFLAGAHAKSGSCPFNEEHEGDQWSMDEGGGPSGGWPDTVN